MSRSALIAAVDTIDVRSWQEFVETQQALAGPRLRLWLFRGQDDPHSGLATTLERALQRFGQGLDGQEDLEHRLLREFRRHYHRYTDDVPSEDDTLRWLALMRHHGAPTRLLDFSYSPYVGLFFAIHGAAHGSAATIWAVDHNWCIDCARRLLPAEAWQAFQDDAWGGKTGPTVRRLFQTHARTVVPLNPYYLDARLAVQQGALLAPLSLGESFESLLLAMDEPAELRRHVRRFVIHCDPGFLETALGELLRMNVTHTSLFPGIDGLAQGLENGALLAFLSSRRRRER
ncbi:MAG: FRG domain-containing protein [Gemmatimonadales bacterium]|jgi:hypothetical protein|nr:FRG domain-containing protein [Gemmatimonadales bacterium]